MGGGDISQACQAGSEQKLGYSTAPTLPKNSKPMSIFDLTAQGEHINTPSPRCDFVCLRAQVHV